MCLPACTQKNYKSAVSGVGKLGEKYVLAELTRKVRSEMAEICSVKYTSFRKNNEELKHFSWDELYKDTITCKVFTGSITWCW